MAYIIMPSLFVNLDTLFLYKHFSQKSIYSLAIQLLNIFEQIHEAGFVYNDLKLDNLMVDRNFNLQQIEQCNNKPTNLFEHN